MKQAKRLIFSLLIGLFLGYSAIAQPNWPPITQQTKPWTRWWWMGSAVNNADLTRLLTEYERAGLGGVEITPIYGVKGEEASFINFLSPVWMNRLTHTLAEAGRLGLGVDLAQASGWPFGGPWVSAQDACKFVAYQTYSVKAGARLAESIQCQQQPIIRTVGEPIALKNLVEPITKNADLQRHAFDQVRFDKPLPLQTLMAYSVDGRVLDLTKNVSADGRLNWTSPVTGGDWTLYALFQGWHGKQVERAGPGGEGDVIDHFSKPATQRYLQHFDRAFAGHNTKPIRAFFNDSYEVDDAQGEANWTPNLLAEFQKRRGYDLRKHLPALLAPVSTTARVGETVSRVLTDYRETVSDLLLENYTKTWGNWAHQRGQLIRNQAHGSPANILDLYALTDIPEIEGTDLLRIKFASSAANVTGKPLISSESATWNNEHFLSTLSDVKQDLDRFWLGGVNHVFYHGTAYSPQKAVWPGWLFYAAVHVNPNNPFWGDFGKLNRYVARCQSFLQTGKPDNDVLVYLPIYDVYARPAPKNTINPALLQHFDGIEHGFKGLPVANYAQILLDKGYGFDFISDTQLQRITIAGTALKTSGGAVYKTIVIPGARIMPLQTLAQLVKLAEQGATVVVCGSLPADVNGLGQLTRRQKAFQELGKRLKFSVETESGVQKARIGKGSFWLGKDLDQLLIAAGLHRETLTDKGLQFVRRSHQTGHYYFIRNATDSLFAGWVPIRVATSNIVLFNPMTDHTGRAMSRTTTNGQSEVYLQLNPGETGILQTSADKLTGLMYPYSKSLGEPQPIAGSWQLRFVAGGPELPAPAQMPSLKSWTDLPGDAVKRFSGTVVYTADFQQPIPTATGWQLNLGRVAETARVTLNGHDLGTLLGPTYSVFVPDSLLKPTNTLTVTVTNGMANRMIDLDKNHVGWKKFYNINMSARLRENRDASGLFTAERWPVRPSGLLGPVTLTPVRLLTERDLQSR